MVYSLRKKIYNDNNFLGGTIVEQTVNGNVYSPTHYQGRKLEVIDIIDDFNLDFYKGNIIKYVLRADKKNKIEDLEKAKWYLNKLIERKINEISY